MKLDESISSQPVKGRRMKMHILLASAVFLLVAASFFRRWPQPLLTPTNSERVLPTPSVALTRENTAGFLGPEKCAACHAKRVDEFRNSRHYLACVPASDDTMPSVFLTGTAEFTPPDSPVSFRMIKDGSQYQQIAIHKSAAGVVETRSPISLIYGFGAETDEVYFSWKEERLSELPMSWLHPHQEWGTGGFDVLGAGDFSRPANPRCIECHNTWLEHIPGTPNQYRPETLIAGVTCEACHGPGKEHVSFHELHPEQKEPMHILRPSELTRSLKMDLCANCHSNALKHRGPAFSYRPGKPLDEFYKTLATRNPEDDHVANQTSYLMQSKCYQRSEDLTCLTCHDPHGARDVSHRGAGTSACLNCHDLQNCDERPRLPEGVRDNCVGCHMPERTKIQVNFDTKNDIYYAPVPLWDHRIAVNNVARDEVLLRWHRSQHEDVHLKESERLAASLAAINEEEGDQCVVQYRYLAAADHYRRSESFRLSESVRRKRETALAKVAKISTDFVRAEHERAEGRIDDAIATLEHLLIDKPDHAEARGRLGTLYANKGRNAEALEQWAAVQKYDPDNAYGEGMIGWYWYLQNEPEKALAALTHADELEPYSFRVNFNLGLILVKLDRQAEAMDHFGTANRIEPQNIDCALVLNAGLRQDAKFQQAIDVIEKISSITQSKHPVIEITRADSLADAGQADAAIAVLLEVQKNFSDADLQLEISNRLKNLNLRSDSETAP